MDLSRSLPYLCAAVASAAGAVYLSHHQGETSVHAAEEALAEPRLESEPGPGSVPADMQTIEDEARRTAGL
jgi:hypothetical protein